jgi:hypothetical protein
LLFGDFLASQTSWGLRKQPDIVMTTEMEVIPFLGTVMMQTSLRPGGMKKEEMLGPWKSPFTEGGGYQIAAALESSHWHKPLQEIARGFVEEVVKVNPNDPKARNPIDLFEKVRTWRQPRTDAKAALLVRCCPLEIICDFEINSFLI